MSRPSTPRLRSASVTAADASPAAAKASPAVSRRHSTPTASVSMSGAASAVPCPVTPTVRRSARPVGSVMAVPPVPATPAQVLPVHVLVRPVPRVNVAAGLQPGMPLERITRRRVPVPDGRPCRGGEIEEQERQSQAPGVLGAVPLLVTQERWVGDGGSCIPAEDDHIAHGEGAGQRQPPAVTGGDNEPAGPPECPGTC